MQIFKRILIHPVTICLLFCFLIISGESSAVFYWFALFLGLPHGVYHSILGVAGITLFLISLFMPETNRKHWADIGGALCMLLSIVRFFTQPGAGYNYNTFRESVPLVLLLLFLVLLLVNMVYHVQRIKQYRISS